MSEFYFECKYCHKQIKVDSEYIGQVGYCPHCNAEVTIEKPQETQPQQKTERTTGTLLNECKACGKRISKNAAACPHCGEPNCTYKSRGFFILFAMLFGMLGIHSAYIGNNEMCGFHIFASCIITAVLSGAVSTRDIGGISFGVGLFLIHGIWIIGEVISVGKDVHDVPLK